MASSVPAHTCGATPKVNSKPKATSRDSQVDGLSLSGSVAARRTTLRLPENLPLTSWRRIGRQINLIGDSSQWWLADWLVYGQSRFPGRYKQAVEETGLEYQTLRNYAYVARRFDVSRRRDKLSFQHHSEVAPLPEPEQDLWLDRAQTFGWSLSEFRQHLRNARQNRDGARGGRPPRASNGQPPRPREVEIAVLLRLYISPEKKERWQAVASTRNQELDEWLVSIADEAADDFGANRVSKDDFGENDMRREYAISATST